MYGPTSKWMAGVVIALALAGCGNEDCDKLGEHLADLAIKEAKAEGKPAAEDKRAEIVNRKCA